MSVNGAVDLEKRRERKSRWRNLLGLAILLAALGWSIVHVTRLAFGPDSDAATRAGKKVIRFAHWQLEGRCVEALNQACRDYEQAKRKQGIEVAVRQIEIPERAYEQWTRTQLIGRTAPDLIELRWWQDLVVRYFVPLTEYVEEPNPWNARFGEDADFAELPWRETYIDNMMGGWNNELRDFYGMPMSLFTIRIYANKTLMERVAGVTEPPKTLGQFMKICERIKAYAAERRASDPTFRLVPIAGSKYTENIYRGRYWAMSTWDLMAQYDENCDGWFDDAERVDAILTGRLDLTTHPNIRAGHRVLYDISRYFDPSFMSARRDQSVLRFARSKAVMIATGTWDAGSLWRQIAGDFVFMVFDFPTPAPDEKYGQYIRHRLTEAGARAGFSMGLTRFSRSKELAVDFMRFLTSRRYNEKLNKAFRWFPAIRGAEPDPILKAFRPEERGTYSVLNLYINPGDTRLRYDQKYQSFISEPEPTDRHYGQFLAAARGPREAFLAQRGLLAELCLKRIADEPATRRSYPFAQYIQDWREDHYHRYITSFAKDYHELALADFHRGYVSSYHRIVQAEAAIASNRAKAVRTGVAPQVRRALASTILGQTSKQFDRARFRAVYEKLSKAENAGGREGATE